SPHLADYLKLPEMSHPDAWVFCDGPVHQSRRMELVFGARGSVDLDLTVYGPIKGLHDGHYGNWVPNPIVRLTHLIDSMRDESGRILIKGFTMISASRRRSRRKHSQKSRTWRAIFAANFKSAPPKETENRSMNCLCCRA